LQSELVGVTAGLGVPSTLTWEGSSSTAPACRGQGGIVLALPAGTPKAWSGIGG
jgi:hypothetical protein